MPAVEPDAFNWWRHRPFTRFWSARVLATLGAQIQIVAIGWHVYDLTHSPMALGLVGLVQFAPALILTPLVGHFADRHDRRLIARLCQTLQFVLALVLAVSTRQGWVSANLIFAVVFLFGAARAFEAPATSALLPQLVPTTWFPRAISVISGSSQAGMIAGPALGGLIYIAGPAAAYLTTSLLFLGASLFTGAIPATHRPVPTASAGWKTMFAGFAYIRSQPVVLGAISLDLFAVLLGGATALLPIYAREILHTGPWGLGLLRAAPAIGALGMSLYLARRPLARGAGKVMFGGVAVFGVATIVFALSTSLPLSLLALLVLGASDMISVVVRTTLVQLETPDAMRGRVSAVNWLFIGSSNQLGEFESGLTAAWLGTVPAALLGGIGTLAVVAIWMWLFPALRRRDRLVQQ